MSELVMPGLCGKDSEEFSTELQRLVDASLVKYAAKGDVGCVKAAVAAGADVNGQAYYDNYEGSGYLTFMPSDEYKITTALMEAAKNGYVECVEELIKAGADVKHEHPYGWTALQTAAQNGELECVKALIKAGSAVNDGNAETCMGALHYAAKGGHTECLKALIDAGADVNDPETTSALVYAAEEGQLECVTVLLEAGTKDRDEALQRAEDGGHDECVKVLKSKQKKTGKT